MKKLLLILMLCSVTTVFAGPGMWLVIDNYSDCNLQLTSSSNIHMSSWSPPNNISPKQTGVNFYLEFKQTSGYDTVGGTASYQAIRKTTGGETHIVLTANARGAVVVQGESLVAEISKNPSAQGYITLSAPDSNDISRLWKHNAHIRLEINNTNGISCEK